MNEWLKVEKAAVGKKKITYMSEIRTLVFYYKAVQEQCH